MSAGVEAVAYLWHRGGEVVALHRVLGGDGLLLEVKGDDGVHVEVELPATEVVELTRTLVDHCREYALETGVDGIDDDS